MNSTWNNSLFFYPKNYDVLVVGSGHSGIEAGLAAARLGCQVAMLTQNLDTVGQMSCNPAIGGLGKGHMVREIDALGGVMGLNTDATAIQWRLLNASKGPSVRAPRAQCDKKAYQFRLKWILENTPNLDLHQGSATEILIKNDRVKGVKTSLAFALKAKTVILSAGTFMGGLMHMGLQNEKGGRMGDFASGISANLAQIGFELERFKTGTPCRIRASSIDFSRCEKQEGDASPVLFSYLAEILQEEQEEIFTLNHWRDGGMFHVKQLPCWITWTNERTHQIIEQNLDKSPMFCGRIEGLGPRYCPSIEDKITRFADKQRHQIFLEPEGRHTGEYYVNGVSTSLPYEVQLDFIRSIQGLEKAELLRAGYAVEYDYCPPTQLFPTLQTKLVEGLYFAGQINGTSGYEEAAGQGLVAGVNAALQVLGKEPFILRRDESYLGVMIDDLVNKGIREPYRMFTSRAEYRLSLRHDNADRRLTAKAEKYGLLCSLRVSRFHKKEKALKKLEEFVHKTSYEGIPLFQWFRKDQHHWRLLPAEWRTSFSDEVWDSLDLDLRYSGYLEREKKLIERSRSLDLIPLSVEIDYSQIRGLKKEAAECLNTIRPLNLGQAKRMSGVTPADISVLSVWLSKNQQKSLKN